MSHEVQDELEELQKAQMRLPAEGNPWEHRWVAVGIITVVKGARIALSCKELVKETWIDKGGETAKLLPQQVLWYLEGCQRSKIADKHIPNVYEVVSNEMCGR